MGVPELRTETIIDAAPEQVWEILVDMARWDEWNPTLFKVKGEPIVGEEVRMKLRLGRFRVPMRQRILVVDRPRELVWNSLQPLPGALDVIRRFQLEVVGSGAQTRLVQSEATAGYLARIEVMLLGRAIVEGYEQLARALARRVGRAAA